MGYTISQEPILRTTTNLFCLSVGVVNSKEWKRYQRKAWVTEGGVKPKVDIDNYEDSIDSRSGFEDSVDSGSGFFTSDHSRRSRPNIDEFQWSVAERVAPLVPCVQA